MNNPNFIVTAVFDFRSRTFKDKAFRTERGALAAHQRANRHREMLGIRQHDIWFRDGRFQRVEVLK